jgi:pyruvate/2-oxoglutarate dehydrogenase complex dihydrolipoamide dehydrogenase (E3) component
VIAAGAEPLIPPIVGISKAIVATASDVLMGKVKVGEKVVVAGGGLVGCEVALFLSQERRKVTVIEMLTDIATDLNAVSRSALLGLLVENGVQIKTQVKLDEVVDDGVMVADKENRRYKIGAETVVLALGLKSRSSIANALKGLAPDVYVIGDCMKPRKLGDAIHEGFNVAVEI